MTLLLASASPARRRLLELAAIPHRVKVSGVDEEAITDPSPAVLLGRRRFGDKKHHPSLSQLKPVALASGTGWVDVVQTLWRQEATSGRCNEIHCIWLLLARRRPK